MLGQNRTHNVANEITDITESTGTAWTTPVQDANGNLTQFPQPLSLGSGYTLKYDAWNRLVQVNNTTGGALVATYRYDGANRRVTNLVSSTTRHYYYSDRWQVLEERLNTATTADKRFVWGLRYLDDLILRDQSSTRHYVLHDYFNVTAIVDTSGNVLERHGYDGFGTVRFMNASFGSASSGYTWETLYGAYRYDATTGLYQVRNRYLHPKLGRWEKRDPKGYVDGSNLMAYVNNHSSNEVDFEGYGPALEQFNECLKAYASTSSLSQSAIDTAKGCLGDTFVEPDTGVIECLVKSLGLDAALSVICCIDTWGTRYSQTAPPFTGEDACKFEYCKCIWTATFTLNVISAIFARYKCLCELDDCHASIEENSNIPLLPIISTPPTLG